MTRAQVKRSEKELEKERKVEAQEQQAQRKASVKVSKSLIAAEGHEGNADNQTASVES